MARVLLMLLIAVILMAGVGAVGLYVQPEPFARYPAQDPPLELVDLPDNLPPPVLRWYQTIYPAGVPVIESAIVSGRASMRVMGITFPARFRFVYQAGQGYRHYIEATVWGFGLLRVNEHYLDNRARQELPFGQAIDNDPQVNQAANLGLWTESLGWLPAALLTNDQVRWEPVDDHSADLVVPFGDDEERLRVRFAPDTGLLRRVEALRYKGAASDGKTLWLNDARGWHNVDGHLVVSLAAVVWVDEGTPWALMTVEEVRYNVPVHDYIRLKGI